MKLLSVGLGDPLDMLRLKLGAVVGQLALHALSGHCQRIQELLATRHGAIIPHSRVGFPG